MKARDHSHPQIAPEFAHRLTSHAEPQTGHGEHLLQQKIAELEAEVAHLRKVGRVREPRKGFGGTIQRLRESKNITLSELARLSGCSKPSVSRIETQDVPNVKLRNILKLASGLGLRPSEVFAEYERENPPNNGT
jgi:DNA-binding Xre family transcriptional regulator